MLRFRDFSIKTKLSLLAVASAAIALTLCCLGFVSNDVRMIKSAKVEECQTLANMLGFHSTALLKSRDAQAAHALLQSLESQPSIDQAALLDADGNVVAAYGTDPQRAVTPPPRTNGDGAGEGYAFTETAPWNSGTRSSTTASRRAPCCCGRT